MVGIRTGYYRSDPDRIKPKTLESASTVVPEVTASIATGVTTATSNSVGQNEIDTARLPSIGVRC
jgi:hypothetical protein